MGFDIECIIDIHNYPGEYFCPVCRTLVYPNEAFQSQCTHLYCKPCLAHVTNGTKACPYDGYLVTESDSKPLIDSDKALAENIGKVKVHCLYFRSGCAWSGTLSDITSHCSECSFGNSPVICNRCGIQIVHRQVHDHAQSCPGAYEGQQATGGVSAVTGSSTAAPSASTAEVNQVVAQPGGPPPQAQNAQAVAATLVPGQNPNLQVNAHSQAPVAAPVAVPTPEQWYQQQYQQYYQQYVGYDPYQQASQQYYSLQQPAFQQYQQHQTQVQGQPQSHVYPQLQPQVQTHPQPQPQSQPQQQPQSQTQPQVQMHQHPNAVSQPPKQSQQLQPQAQGQQQLQVPPQGQAPPQAPTQAFMQNYQAPQQQAHSSTRPQTQVPQVLPPPPPPPPHSQSTNPPLSTQPMGMRPFVQHPQVPQYQQPHVQIHHAQVPQNYVQPQMQPQSHAQSSNQSHVQIQPQAQHYNTQAQPPNFPPQANYSAAPAALPQAPHPPVPPVSGHHSYQQPQPALKMHSGGLQQHLVHPHPASGSLYPPAHGQVPQQPGVMRPPLPHALSSQQQPSTPLPTQHQVTGIPPSQHQQVPPHAQQPTHPIQHRAVMQPVQQATSQYYAQQQHFPAPFPNQHQQGQLSHQQPVQPQMRPSGPPQPPQSQNYAGRPLIPNQGMHLQNQPFSTGGFVSQAHSGSAQLASAQTSINQNYKTSSVVEQNKTDQKARSPSKVHVEKGLDSDSVKEVVVKGQNEIVVNDADSDAKDGSKSVIKQEEDVQGALEQASSGKSSGSRGAQGDLLKEEGHSLANPGPLKQVDIKTAGAGPSSSDMDLQPQTAVSASSTEERVSALQTHGSHQQRPQAKGQGQPPSVPGPEGPVILPHAGQSLNPTEGRVSGYFAPPLKSFEPESGPQGHALTTLAEPRVVVGRATPLRFEGQCGPQHVDRPSEVTMSKDQMPGSADGGPPMRTHADEPSFLRMNGGATPESSVFGRRDEKPKALSREHLNPFPASTFPYKASHGPIYDSGLKLDPGAMGPPSRSFPHRPPGGHADMYGPGAEPGQHHMKHFGRTSPDREYSSPYGFVGPSNFSRSSSGFDDINSREAHGFSEGSRSTNVSSGLVGNPFRDGRYTSFSENPRRGDNGDMGNHRFGDHMAPGPLRNQIGNDDVLRADGPGHSVRGKFSGPGYLQDQFNVDGTAGSRVFPGHGRVGELSGPGGYPRHPFTESVRGDRSSFPQFGDPTMRNYSLPGFPNSGNFAGEMDPFDHSRKRKSMSTGWCRICSVDCESVEGLDMHSQTREHQRMAMDMVKSIKLQNRKMHRAAGMVHHEGGSRTRRAGAVGRGSKP